MHLQQTEVEGYRIKIRVDEHLTQSLLQNIREYPKFKSPDGESYIIHLPPDLNAFIQIVSFEKLIEDARMRHRAFFEKLNLPDV